MANNKIRVGNVEILSLSDGTIEFDLCNFFPMIPDEHWRPYASHLTEEHHVRFTWGPFWCGRLGGRSWSTRALGPSRRTLPRFPGVSCWPISVPMGYGLKTLIWWC